MRISQIISLLLIVSLLGAPYAGAADTETDFNATRTHVNTIQAVNPSLPTNVPQQRGSIGEIVSRLFDSNGKIGNWYLKVLGTRSDNAVLRWSGGNGGQLVQGSIFDDGTSIFSTGQMTVGSSAYDANGGLVVRGTGENLFIIQTNDNTADTGIAFRNSGGAYSNVIYRTDIGGNDSDLRIAGGDSNSTIGSLTDYVTIEGGPSGGNVGIGNTNPGYKLDVSGDVNFTGDLRKNGTIVNFAGKWEDGTNPLDVSFMTGDVGVGTLTPGEALSVVGRISSTVDPNSDDDIGDRGYNDARYLNTGEKAADSNLLDGIDSANFLRSNVNDTMNGQLTISRGVNENLLAWPGGYLKRKTNQGGFTMGSDSSVMLHAGDNTDNLANDVGMNAASTAEILYLTADNDVRIISGRQANYATSNSFIFSTAGNVNFPGNLTLGGTLAGDSITDNTIDSTEIENDTITEADISDTFVARDSNLLDTLDSTAFIRSNAADNVSAHTEWQDGQHVRFGNSADFRMWWDGTNNRMYQRSFTHGAPVTIQGEDAGGTNRNLIHADPDGDTRLYFGGAQKLATSAVGVNVTGTVTASDPTAAGHLATKGYVDTLVTQGATWKGPVESGNTLVGTWGACDASRQSWVTYNKNDDIIYLCDGSTWINIGSSASVPYATTISAGKVQISGDLQGTWNNINLKDGSVDSASIADLSIVREDIATNQIYSNHIVDGQVSGADMATDTVTVGNIAPNAVGNSELINNAAFDVGSLKASNAAGISWENGINNITHNDGGGNVQIRFGHDYTASDERFTHGGSAFYIGGDLDDTTAGTANLDFKVSTNGGAGNDATVSWGKIFRIGDNELTWDGDTILTDASSVNADTLDGIDSVNFLRSNVADTMNAKLTLNSATYDNHLRFIRSGETWDISPSTDGSLNFIHTAGAAQNRLEVPGLESTNNITVGGNTVWHAGNDGAGSSLDADTLDGVTSANFLRSNQNDTMNGELRVANTAHAPGANAYNVEISSPDTGDGNNELSLRFHQANRYYYQIRARSGGFRFTDGNDDDLAFISVATPTNTDHAVTKGYADALITNIPGDNIQDGTIDSSEIQNNTLTASDLAPNSVGNSELIDNPVFSDIDLHHPGSAVGWAGTFDFFAPNSPAGANNRRFLMVNYNNAAGNYLEFRSSNDDGSAKHANILSLHTNGNVGIGTTNTTSKLEVAGNIAGNDLISGGTNTWQLHTPDDGRRTLYFGTASSTYGSKSWPITFDNTGAISATSFAGNGAALTNVNADTLDSFNSSQSSTPSTVAVRNTSGDINARLFRSEYDTTNPNIGYIMTQIDTASNNYIRPSTPAQFRAAVTDSTYINIGSSGDQIQDGTIDSSEIQDNTLTNADIADGTVRTQEIANNTITENDISDSFVARNSNQLGGIGSNRTLNQKADIGGSANLNTYTTTGLYHQNSNASASSGTNYPTALAGMLEVIEDGVMVYQKYSTYDSAHNVYVRTYYNGTWYGWKRLFYQNDSGDHIADGTIDSSEIQDNTLTASDLAANSVGNSELNNSESFTVAALTNNGNLNMTDGDVYNVRELEMKDYDDNTGGADNKYRLLARDGSFQFYNGGVVVGGYGNGTWTDVPDGHLIVKSRVGVGITPSGNLAANNSIAIGDGDTGFKQISDGMLTVYTNNQERVRFENGGNVGIGLTDPTQKLEVSGNARINGNLYINNTDTRLFRSAANVLTTDDTVELRGGSTTLRFNDTTAGDSPFLMHMNSSRLYFMHDANENLTWDDGDDDRIVMYSPGNGVRLGVGTSTPTGRVHINFTSDASLTSTAHALTIGSITAENLAIDGNEIVARNNGATSQLNLNITGGDVRIGTDIEVRAGQVDDVTCIGNCF